MRLPSAVCALLFLAGCALAPARSAPEQGVPTAALMRLYQARDYFALRARLQALSGVRTPELLVLRAAVRQAFNDPARSQAAADSAVAGGNLSDSLRLELARIRINNDLRLFRYAEGARRAAGLLRDFPDADPGIRDDVRNLQRLFDALRDVPPQTVERRGPTRVAFEQGFIPVRLNGQERRYGFDTGANLSTIMRSEARALGMRIRPARLEVGSSTDKQVTADLAVADSVRIGGLEFRHVVFLVLDDSLLTFPGGFRIPGLIGFPVIEAMGEVRVVRRDTLEVPERVPRRTAGNLALQQLLPLTTVEWQGDALICNLDTGAGFTQFYQPFYERHREWIRAAGRLDTMSVGGAGGVRRLEVYRLRGMRLAVGDTSVVLDSTSVLTHSIEVHEKDNYADCNLGHDVFDAFHEYIVNFRDMAFLLR